MEVRVIALSLLASALITAGCGSICVSSCGALPPPALVVSEKDFGTSVSAVLGQTVEVHLTDRRPFPGTATIWTVSSEDPGALAPAGETRGAAAPMHDVRYRALFTALNRGTVKLLAAGVTSCEAMQKSACPDRSEQITIEIR